MTRAVFPRFVPVCLIKDGWWLTAQSDNSASAPPSVPSLDGAARWLPPLGRSVLPLVILADWLFWDRYVGLSLALFALAIVGLAISVTWGETTPHARKLAGIVIALACLPTLNAIGFFPVIFLILGTIAAVLILHARLTARIWHNAKTFLWFIATGPAWIVLDAIAPRTETPLRLPTQRFLNAWLLPLGLGLIFLALFARANPVMEEMVFAVISIDWLDAELIGRAIFWLGVLCLCWPFIHMRPARPVKPATPNDALAAPAWFEQAAIRNALILFNGLFALQTMMDVSYLWGGVTLPEGMTYASYAHRGAYPLLATSLLAGLFMLAATSFGPLERTNKTLLYLWIAQNLGLVISSILRLNLYVAFYSLTYMRVAAFIWMGLVLLGLLLIAYRLAHGRSNAWVLSRIAGAGLLTLYLGCFVNFASLIAEFNVTHSREISGEGLVLDRRYLCDLGAQAHPAADRFLKETGSPVEGFHASNTSAWLAARFWRHQDNWRDWGLRDHRLARYLRAQYGEQ